MPAATLNIPALVTPAKLENMELERLRIENANYRERELIAREAYLRLKGETETLRKDLATERLNNGADRRRMDLLVALCQLGRTDTGAEIVHVDAGNGLRSLNSDNLRGFLDQVLESRTGHRISIICHAGRQP